MILIQELTGNNTATGSGWQCVTPASHDCTGIATVAVTQTPCCPAGAVREQAWQEAQAAAEHAEALADAAAQNALEL
jgi:hypothetical protein